MTTCSFVNSLSVDVITPSTFFFFFFKQKTAYEINATDLRRRLHLQRKDEFGELAATFDHMLARLEAAFKRQAQFTADASHELRTPLTIIDLEINRALTQTSSINPLSTQLQPHLQRPATIQ